MAQEKGPEFKGSTPKGVFKWPHITKPDYGTDEFPKPDGELNVRLILGAEDAAALRAKLKPILAEADRIGRELDAKRKPAQRKQKPYVLQDIGRDVYDEDEEDPAPTGEVEFHFKTKYSGVTAKGTKWTKTLPILDAKGQEVKGKIDIWGGTVGRVGFTARPYFVAAQGMAGVSLYLDLVKVIELKSGGGHVDAHAYGMDDDEGDEDSFSSDDIDPMTEDESVDADDAVEDDGSGDF